MEYSNLGASGLKVSRLALGCMSFGSSAWRPWVLDEAESTRIIHRAVELGVNFLDTADMYAAGASEVVVGKAIRSLPRQNLVIATKVGNAMSADPNDRGLSRKHIENSIDASLKRLGTDYVDLYQVHLFDYDTPVEETLDALARLVDAGKVRYLGASNMFAWQFMKMLGLQKANGLPRFVSMQDHYNLIYREEEREMLPLCRSEGVGVIPWSPLAKGMLAGTRAAGRDATVRAKADRYAGVLYQSDEQDLAIVEAVRAVAERHGHPMAQIAIAWLLSRPGVCAPIVGVSGLAQLEDAVAATDIQLSDDDVAEMERPYRPKSIAGHR